MAFGLALALFAYFWIVGFAILSVLYRRDDRIRTSLIAPVVGIVATVYANYLLSRFGFPIFSIARPLGAVSLIGALALLIWRHPTLPGKRGRPYLLVLAVAFIASGWPLFVHGYSWLADLNPDATYYLLDANRLLYHPYITEPDTKALVYQTDWSNYYFSAPLLAVRTGVDLLLAWVAALTRQDGPSIYMPLTVAIHVAALACASALVSKSFRLARLLTLSLLAVTAMATLGVTLQLIAQELGVACLCLACVLMLSRFYRLSPSRLARFAVLTALALAGFAISYPEMLPFLGIAFAVYHLAGVRELLRYWQRFLIAGVAVGLMAASLISPDVLALLRLVFAQLESATTTKSLAEVFPYFLIPSGIGALWGLRLYVPGGMALFGSDFSVATGIFLSAIVAIGIIQMVLRREASAYVLAVMAILAVPLIRIQSGFGVFKLAMYSQSFLMSTAILSLCADARLAGNRGRHKLSVLAILALLGLANCISQSQYLARASRQSWVTTLGRLRDLRNLAPEVPVMIGLQDYALPELTALYTKGHPTWNIDGQREDLFINPLDPKSEELSRRMSTSYLDLAFDLGSSGKIDHFLRFEPPVDVATHLSVVVLPARNLSVVNDSQMRPETGQLYIASLADQHNVLVQVDASLGHVITPGVIDDIGLWQHESDFAGAPAGMQGIGRDLLFEVLNPTPNSRLLIDFTSGGLAGQGMSLPPAVVIGEEEKAIGFEGRGAGRVLSLPVTPREIAGHLYIAIDMGVDATQFHADRHGLDALYNVRLGDDSRRLVGFVRNISLLSPEQVAKLDPPASLRDFPAGLLSPRLLFSGISEDGWIASKAWVRLGLPGPSGLLHVSGMVPAFSKKILDGTLSIFVDGIQVFDSTMPAGAFSLVLPIPEASGPRRIEFDMTGVDRFPPPDGRLVSFNLTDLSLSGHKLTATNPSRDYVGSPKE